MLPAKYTIIAELDGETATQLLDAFPNKSDRMGEHGSATFEAIARIMDAAHDRRIWSVGAIELRYYPDDYPGDFIVLETMDSKV